MIARRCRVLSLLFPTFQHIVLAEDCGKLLSPHSCISWNVHCMHASLAIFCTRKVPGAQVQGLQNLCNATSKCTACVSIYGCIRIVCACRNILFTAALNYHASGCVLQGMPTTISASLTGHGEASVPVYSFT